MLDVYQKLKKEFGKHKDYNACLIGDIKDEKIYKLKENKKYLEELSNDLQEQINS